MPETCCNQRTTEWLAERKGKITASVAAACLGIGPRSRQWAWREITGNNTEAEKRHNDQDFNIRYGQNFEAVARNDYEADTGNLVTETGFWVHDSLPWLGCSPDGLIGTDGLLECKCPEKLYERVPIHYRVQCLVQLACTGRAWCDFYGWSKDFGPDGRHLTFLRRIHRAGIAGLIVRLDRFRREYVETNTCPPRARRRVRA